MYTVKTKNRQGKTVRKRVKHTWNVKDDPKKAREAKKAIKAKRAKKAAQERRVAGQQTATQQHWGAGQQTAAQGQWVSGQNEAEESEEEETPWERSQKAKAEQLEAQADAKVDNAQNLYD